MLTGHSDVASPSLKLPSQVTVDCIQLTIKTHQHRSDPFPLSQGSLAL